MTELVTYYGTPAGLLDLATGYLWDAARIYGYPWRGNTGWSGELTPYTGPMTITEPGTVLENYDIVGDIRFDDTAIEAVVSNCRIRSNGFWPCRLYGGGIVQDTEIQGGPNSQASLFGVNMECARLDLHGAGDGVRLGASSLVDSYIHDMADFEGAHNDAVEIMGEQGGPNRITHNSILNRVGQTSALMMSEWGHNPDVDTIVEDNLIAGGVYSVYGYSPDTDIIGGLQVINNKFSTMFFPNSGSVGPVNVWPGSPNVWSGNEWIDGPNAGTPVLVAG